MYTATITLAHLPALGYWSSGGEPRAAVTTLGWLTLGSIRFCENAQSCEVRVACLLEDPT